MSLPTDIIQLFGPKSVPVIIFGSVLAGFELGERFASQRAKDALSNWLLTFDIRNATALPDGTQELFEKIFGERHFSLKCFVRSAIFSLGAMFFVGLLALLISPNPNYFLRYLTSQFRFTMEGANYDTWLLIALWLPWSILIDYISLFKTRVILQILTRMRRTNKVVAIGILVLDFLLYELLFNVGMRVIFLLLMVISLGRLETEIGFWFYSFMWLPPFREPKDVFVFFWSGFAPSIWMWLYVLALFVTRALLGSEKNSQLASMVF